MKIEKYNRNTVTSNALSANLTKVQISKINRNYEKKGWPRLRRRPIEKAAGRPFTFPEMKPLRWKITLSELNSCTSSVRIGYKKLCLDWTLYLLGNFQFKVFKGDVFVSSMHHCWLGSWMLILDFFLFMIMINVKQMLQTNVCSAIL